MSEPRKSRLPIPLGSILEGSLSRAREDRLWARIQKRRGDSSLGHSEPPKAGMFLPAPVARVLDSTDDLTDKRSRVWRQIQARRKDARSRSAFGSAFTLGFAVAACASLVMFFRPELSQLATRPTREVRPAMAQGALTEADGRTVQNWSAGPARRVVRLSDASELRIEPGAELRPTLSSGSRFELLLARGAAEFSVTPGGPRRWIIEAGLARVEVLGTVFRVERTAERVRVSVSRGRVLVRSEGLPGGAQYLTVGQSVEVLPAQPPAPAPVEALAPQEEDAVTLARAPSAQQPPRVQATRRVESDAEWKQHVKEGRFVEAYESLGPVRFVQEAARARSPEALLSLADAARLSGHPGDAALPLERVLSDFSESPHAALAAFTLGRVLLDQLRLPERAAHAFEQAITMRPPSALLADCHARLVEAYARSGDVTSAERAAARYRTLFPAGRHDVDVAAWKKRE